MQRVLHKDSVRKAGYTVKKLIIPLAIGVLLAAAGCSSQDSDTSGRVKAENFIMLAEPMQALGFGDTESEVEFTFVVNSEDTISVQFSAVDHSMLNMSDFHFVNSVTLPLFL